MKTISYVDSAGLGVSSLCIIHCLFLPILGTSLPILGVLSEYEWLHKARDLRGSYCCEFHHHDLPPAFANSWRSRRNPFDGRRLHAAIP